MGMVTSMCSPRRTHDDKIAWYENLSPTSPRSAMPTAMASLIPRTSLPCFKRASTRTAFPQNSTFAEGDWNGDHEFDSGDLVLAFQQGTYESGAQPAVSASIGSALATEAGRGLQGINHERTTKQASARSLQPIAAARHWDVAHVDQVFAEHARSGVRGRGAISHGTILDVVDDMLDEAIL